MTWRWARATPASTRKRSNGFSAHHSRDILAIKIKRGRAKAIGAECGHMGGLQPSENFRARVSERISVSRRDHREARLDSGEEFRSSGSRDSVMRHFQ